MSQESTQQKWDRVFGHGEPYTTLYTEIINMFDGTEEAWQLSSLLSVLDKFYDNEEDVHYQYGYRWVQISAQQLKTRLTAWDEDHIKHLLNRLVELGWLLVVEWPLPSAREAVWYSINHDALNEYIDGNTHREGGANNMLQNTSPILSNDEPITLPRVLVCVFGWGQAYFIQQVHCWLRVVAKGGGGKVDESGRPWFYKSIAEWEEEFFPLLARSAINKYRRNLIEKGILIQVEEINKAYRGGTRTWYTLNYDKLSKYIDQNTRQEGG